MSYIADPLYPGAMGTTVSQTLDGLDTGALLRSARTGAELTQAELARRLGTTQSAISRWERSGEEPRLSSLRAALRACGLRARLVIEPDDGVDRAQIRERLAMTPAQRLTEVANVSRLRAVARRA